MTSALLTVVFPNFASKSFDARGSFRSLSTIQDLQDLSEICITHSILYRGRECFLEHLKGVQRLFNFKLHVPVSMIFLDLFIW